MSLLSVNLIVMFYFFFENKLVSFMTKMIYCQRKCCEVVLNVIFGMAGGSKCEGFVMKIIG